MHASYLATQPPTGSRWLTLSPSLLNNDVRKGPRAQKVYTRESQQKKKKKKKKPAAAALTEINAARRAGQAEDEEEQSGDRIGSGLLQAPHRHSALVAAAQSEQYATPDAAPALSPRDAARAAALGPHVRLRLGSSGPLRTACNREIKDMLIDTFFDGV